MKYNFIKTDNVIESIFDINSTTLDELNKEYDFTILDEVVSSFKNILDQNKDKKFLIVGDYDCDGICATTIIKKLFMYLNINSNFYIPSRIKDGYGLNIDIVDVAIKNNFDVLFLVDNGITCNETIDYANNNGLKVFIIDHHEYDTLPKAEAIIHSNLVNDKYKNLSAGGLSLLLALQYYYDEQSIILGGLTTLSDVMPVYGFNRYLIKTTLELLNNNKYYQIYLLNDRNKFDYVSLSYVVIPKINAISRMEPLANPNHLVEFLLSNKKASDEHIESINYVNEQRKTLSKKMTSEAYSLINDKDIIVVASKNFSEGLCGLVANRLVYSLKKPVICLAYIDGMYKGSGRSIDGFNFYDALKDYNHFDSFGGHEGAVGLSIKEKDYESFIKYVNSVSYNTQDSIQDVLLIDEELISFKLLEELKKLEPFGQGFVKPLIAIKNNNFKKIVVSNRFPKYIINNNLSAISFDEKHLNIIPEYLIGNIQKDNYYNNSLQLIIEDLV